LQEIPPGLSYQSSTHIEANVENVGQQLWPFNGVRTVMRCAQKENPLDRTLEEGKFIFGLQPGNSESLESQNE